MISLQVLLSAGFSNHQWRRGRGGGRHPVWKIQGKLCFQCKLKLLKNP